MKVKMFPSLEDIGESVGGISTLIRKYYQHLPLLGITFVDNSNEADLYVVHAGAAKCPQGKPIVAMLHGLYWGDNIGNSQREVNRKIVESVRVADVITVPSDWVAQPFRRDMRINPDIVPHGIDIDDWKNDNEHQKYVLWNKNIRNDVCNPEAVQKLAEQRPDINFITTYAPVGCVMPNVAETGTMKHEKMKELVKCASLYLSTVEETFCIGVLEAMAAGVPQLGWAIGGNLDLIQHGVTGYLAQKDNYTDLLVGLNYCIEHREILSKNSITVSKEWTWEKACKKIISSWEKAIEIYYQPSDVTVVIPVYNKEESQVRRTVQSVLTQTLLPKQVIVVNDASDNGINYKEIVESFNSKKIIYIEQPTNQGVAKARNLGVSYSETRFTCCLDSDDSIEPEFLQACVEALNTNKDTGIAYTKLMAQSKKDSVVSGWPPDIQDFDRQCNSTKRYNQIPTCCVFRTDIWKRIGGQRSRYAPSGAGSEDAAIWTMFGAIGYKSILASHKPLFNYSEGGGFVSGNKEYIEKDWLSWYPWAKDKVHPFASIASPMKGKATHTVRTYSQPSVSIIIPVGPGHINNVFDALDSVEAQTYRNWEIIVINDSGEYIGEALKPYPYVKLFETPGKIGAGAARNLGVSYSRSPLILFLDADDTFNTDYPNVLNEMINLYAKTGSAVYTDYIGRAYANWNELADDIKNNTIAVDNKDGEIFYRAYALDFDCVKANREPVHGKAPYIWNLVSTLFPRQWHNEIGGFDEHMPALEDWEYWLRMSYSGKCFHRLKIPGIIYKYYSGTRRETIGQIAPNLIKYIIEKNTGEKRMCSSCGKNKSKIKTSPVKNTLSRGRRPRGNMELRDMNDNDYILCRYEDGRAGKHAVIGTARMNGKKIKYGYKKGRGMEREPFLVHARDIAAQPHRFIPVQTESPIHIEEKVDLVHPPIALSNDINSLDNSNDTIDSIVNQPIVQPIEKPIVQPIEKPLILDTLNEYDTIDKSFSLEKLPGVNPKMSKLMKEAGMTTKEDILTAGVGGLMSIKGIGKTRARIIIKHLEA